MRPGEPSSDDRGFIRPDARDQRDDSSEFFTSFESTQPNDFKDSAASTHPDTRGAGFDHKLTLLPAHWDISEQAGERRPVSANLAHGEVALDPDPAFQARLLVKIIERADALDVEKAQRAAQRRQTIQALPPHIEIVAPRAPLEGPLVRLLARLEAYVRQTVDQALHGRHTVQWAMAVSLILVIALTCLTMWSGPGQTFYPLHHIFIEFSAVASGEQAAQDSLQKANTALNSFVQIAPKGNDVTTLDDLDALTKANSQAYRAIQAVKDDQARSKLTSLYMGLLKRENKDMRAALTYLEWLSRSRVTDALRWLNLQGNVLVTVDFAQIISPKSKSPHANGLMTIVVIGDNFVKGSVLLVNGAVAGKVVRTTDGTLTAHLSADAVKQIANIGVGLPDGTAAYTTSLVFVERTPNKAH